MFQVPAADHLFGPEETQEVVSVAAEKLSDRKAVQTAASPEETDESKKPAGAVSLFGGINVLGDEDKTTTVRMKSKPPPFECLTVKLYFYFFLLNENLFAFVL